MAWGLLMRNRYCFLNELSEMVMRNKMKPICMAVGLGLMALSTMAQANSLYFQMNPNYSADGVRQAFVFGAEGATGTVSGNAGGFSQSFTLGVDGFAVINLPISELANNTIENKGFSITSSSAVSGYFLNRLTATTDMSYLIDGDKLGTSYVVASYNNILPDQISAQALVDNTTVTFKLANGETITQVLNAGQTYMTARNASLTGSFVTSDKPISVFSGNQCANVPSSDYACDHLMEQMPSISSLSTQYLLARTPRTGANGDLFRVVATENGTEIKVNGVVVATLAAGQIYEGRVGAAGAVVDASKKVLVAQYLVGQSQGGGNTDPAMTIVPGSDQWLKSYVFATPSGTADFPSDYVTIVVKTADIGTTKVKGNPISATNCIDMGNGYSYCNIDVSATSGAFGITSDNPFELLLSGYDNYDSYFTYGGAAFAPGASDPGTSNGVPEPGTIALFGLGLMGAIGFRRRKPN